MSLASRELLALRDAGTSRVGEPPETSPSSAARAMATSADPTSRLVHGTWTLRAGAARPLQVAPPLVRGLARDSYRRADLPPGSPGPPGDRYSDVESLLLFAQLSHGFLDCANGITAVQT
ncbi:MAG: hypothetical protein WCF04_00410 [Candidatus Nanopelagicales bacterium]